MLICRMCMKTFQFILFHIHAIILWQMQKSTQKRWYIMYSQRWTETFSSSILLHPGYTNERSWPLDEIIFATYLMPIFTKLSKSTQRNSPSTQEIRSKWLIPFQLVTLHDLHPQSRQLNLNSPTRVQHPKTYIYTNIFPTIFTNTTLKKITTDSTHPWPFFFVWLVTKSSQDALGIRIPPSRSAQLHGGTSTSHPICCALLKRLGEVIYQHYRCQRYHHASYPLDPRETWAWRGHHLGQNRKNGSRKHKLKVRGIRMCQRSIKSCLTVINLRCAIV